MTAEELAKNEILLVLLFQASRHSEAELQRVQTEILPGSVGSANLLLFQIKQLRTLEETIDSNLADREALAVRGNEADSRVPHK